MQNANIKYKIRLNKLPHDGKEIELTFTLDEMEGMDAISDKLFDAEYFSSMGHPSDYYTVIERNIELFNED